MIQNTHYCIDSTTGVPMFGCTHEWDVTHATAPGNKSLIVRYCMECGRYEKWLSLASARKAIH